MERIKEFFVKNKSDVLSLSIILVLFIVCTVLLWGYWGSLYVDNGRESYLPHLVLQGKVLYKEIFAMYNPLSYQINAAAYKVFGESFNTLYLLGTFNAFLIIIGLYKIARLFLKPFYSLCFCISMCGLYIFSSLSPINYIFPYAYAFPYALCGFVYFVLFTLLYLQKENKKFIFPASLVLGISLACKFEFSLSYMVLLVLLIYKKENFLTIIKSVFCYLLPSALSWGILLLQGFTVQDLITYVDFGKKFFNTAEQVLFSKNNTYPFTLMSFLEVCVIFVSFLIFAAVNIKTIDSISKKLNPFFKIILILILLFLNVSVVKILFLKKISIFAWVCLSSIFIASFGLKPEDKNRFLLSILALFGVFSGFRFHLLLLGTGYSIYMILVPLLANYIYILKFNKFIQKHNFQKSFVLFLMCFSLITLSFSVLSRYATYVKLKTDKGVIAAVRYQAEPFNKAIDYINKNTLPNDEVVMLPEGPMINFVTNRNTDSMYYHLIPNHISALGEENIVNEFKQNPPKYFLINNSNNSMYGADYFCNDFGLLICDYIKNNYSLEEHFESNSKNKIYFYIDVYKIK